MARHPMIHLSCRISGQKLRTNLPDDVITDILAILPLESRQRFKCVSKLWRTTIENQEKLLIVTKEISYSTFDFIKRGKVEEEEFTSPPNNNPIITLPTKFHISLPIHISSCHGLVFMALEDGSMILWNPTSRKYDEVPLVPEANNSDTSSSMYCFGYDPFSSDYKIVRLMKTTTTTTNTCSWDAMIMHEFSRKKRCWRMINRDILSNKYEICTYNDPVVYDGAFHFLAITTEKSRKNKENERQIHHNYVALSYSLKDGIFYETFIIPYYRNRDSRVRLCLYRHRLSWWSSESIGDDEQNFEVWSIFGDNWENVISKTKIYENYCRLLQVKFVRNGGDLLVMNNNVIDNDVPIIYKYHPRSHAYLKIEDDHYVKKFAKAESVEYVSSWVSPAYP